jgi:hypothetical protein
MLVVKMDNEVLMISSVFLHTEANRALAALIRLWHEVERDDVVCQLRVSEFFLDLGWA